MVGLPLTDMCRPVWQSFEFGEQKPNIDHKGRPYTRADMFLDVSTHWRVVRSGHVVLGHGDYGAFALDPESDAVKDFFDAVKKGRLICRRVSLNELLDLTITLDEGYEVNTFTSYFSVDLLYFHASPEVPGIFAANYKPDSGRASKPETWRCRSFAVRGEPLLLSSYENDESTGPEREAGPCPLTDEQLLKEVGQNPEKHEVEHIASMQLTESSATWVYKVKDSKHPRWFAYEKNEFDEFVFKWDIPEWITPAKYAAYRRAWLEYEGARLKARTETFWREPQEAVRWLHNRLLKRTQWLGFLRLIFDNATLDIHCPCRFVRGDELVFGSDEYKSDEFYPYYDEEELERLDKHEAAVLSMPVDWPAGLPESHRPRPSVNFIGIHKLFEIELGFSNGLKLQTFPFSYHDRWPFFLTAEGKSISFGEGSLK